MAPAFGMKVTTEVIHYLQLDKTHEALWIIREKEVVLYEDKEKLERLIEDIQLLSDEKTSPCHIQRLSIKEVSTLLKLPKSTIRYWEHAEYVVADRDPNNCYRYYNGDHLLIMRLLQIMQNFVYSEETVKYKQWIAATEHRDLQNIMKLATEIRSYLNNRIESQMCGISRLYQLIQSINKNETH